VCLGEVLDFPGTVSFGQTLHETRANLADAERCAGRGRYDDAVAPLYRACEAAAQFRLAEIRMTDNPDGKVPLDWDLSTVPYEMVGR
jgi:hypothetical protein